MERADAIEYVASLCRRVKDEGIGALPDEDLGSILELGVQSGFEFNHDSVVEYCDDILQAVGKYISALEPPPSKKYRQQRYPDHCIFENVGEYGQPEDAFEQCEVDDEGSIIDPISLDDIDPARLVRVRCNGGKLYCYDIDSLKGIVDSDPRDPITRRPLPAHFQKQVLRAHNYHTKTGEPLILMDWTSESVEDNPDLDDDITVAEMKREIDALFDPVERVIEYAERINDSDKRRYNSRIVASKKHAKDFLDLGDLPLQLRHEIAMQDAQEEEQSIREAIFVREFE